LIHPEKGVIEGRKLLNLARRSLPTPFWGPGIGGKRLLPVQAGIEPQLRPEKMVKGLAPQLMEGQN